MPLTLPNLDDRRWTDLVEEGRALIPVYAPGWTDHNIHDPGITLIELFAWLAEMDIYQLNRVPDAHRRKFLALVGVEPEPPQPARGVLSLGLQTGSAPLHLPATVEFEGRDPNGIRTCFRTLEDVTVVESQLVAVQVYDGAGFHDRTGRLSSREVLHPFGDDPRPGAALYLGFDPPLPAGVPVSLYFVWSETGTGQDERQRILNEMRAQEEVCRPPAVDCPPGAGTKRQPGASAPEETSRSRLAHHSARTVWEFVDRRGEWQQLAAHPGPSGDGSDTLAVDDDTRSFTLDGRVVLTLPGEMGTTRVGEVEAALPYLRCRFVSGGYDAAPALHTLVVNGVAIEQASAPDALDTVVPGDPRRRAQLLGTGTGLPFQQLQTAEQPVVASSFRLYVEEGVWRAWDRRPDFYASGRTDSHYLLDPTTGTVTVGDGEQGRVVPKGARIWASYLATRAEAGNLAAGAVDALADSSHNRWLSFDLSGAQSQLVGIANPVPARGGAAAETLFHAQGRTLKMLEQPTRAITLADYQRLALETPGVRLARSFAWANLHPAFPCFKAPGVITLIVLPHLPRGRPFPTPELRRAVAAYLNLRRVIGTRVEVVGPIYTRVTVHAHVRPCRGVNAAALRQRIADRLSQFFDPLSGGPDGEGWPFGRDVYRSEVLQVIDEVEGVDHVLALELAVGDDASQCGNVCIPPTGLIESGRHQIEVEGEPCRGVR